MAGIRVVRGPDWKWEDKDGGEGHVGFITGRGQEDGWVEVSWDKGTKGTYRAGAEGAADLVVVDNGPAGTHHPQVMCDNCEEENVRGLRWKCADCANYDLCTECYGNDKHDMGHKFRRIDWPSDSGDGSDAGELVSSRSSESKHQMRGIYKGATVVRGPDWRWGTQDDGEGNVGKVEKQGYKKEDGMFIHSVVVKWPHSSNNYIYSHGWMGKVDVQTKQEAIGWGYYKSHLPPLKDVEDLVKFTSTGRNAAATSRGADGALDELMNQLGSAIGRQAMRAALRTQTETQFNVGDRVKMSADLDSVRRLQEGHGGFNILMIGCLDKVGVVTKIDDDGDLMVKFGGVEWALNPELITKMKLVTRSPAVIEAAGRFQVGDKVVINKKISETMDLQQDYGGWNNAMAKLIEKQTPGTITEITNDGRIVVKFDSKSLHLNPLVCGIISEKERKGSSFKVGDSVLLKKDVDFVKKHQEGHGGWNDLMKKVMERAGTVKEVDDDGDLLVECGDLKWTLNPQVCELNDGSRKKAKKSNKNMNETVEAAAAEANIFHVGDKVTMVTDVDFIRRHQKDHGGWNDSIKQVVGSTGTVRDIDADGDIMVDFKGKQWTLNPEVCRGVTRSSTGDNSKTVKGSKGGSTDTGAAVKTRMSVIEKTPTKKQDSSETTHM